MASWPGSCTAIWKPCRAHKRQLVGLERTLHEQDRLAGAGVAQAQRLLDAGHAQHVGLGQGRQDAGGAVAVGVGLDDRDDPGAAGTAARLAQIVAQGSEVDDGLGGSHQA